VLRAAVVAGVLSGLPSTAWALLRGTDPLEASLAAGALLRPHAAARRRLLAAAVLAHGVLSAGWSLVIACLWPRRTLPVAEALARGAGWGAGVAALDLGMARVSRRPRFAAVRALPLLPQLADHLAFGAIAGAVLNSRQTSSIASAMESSTRPGR
jgi:hypothetical protein